MSRHNRRRTRGGHKMSGLSDRAQAFPVTHSPVAVPAPPPPKTLSDIGNSVRRDTLSARHWHNRYMVWQIHEQRQQEESATMEAEKRRIFGDMDGDDEGLCVKMMEYFGGLDFIR